LLRDGAAARAVTGVLPTVTYPSHATLVTGVAPARHGILANRPFDLLGRDRDGWYWYAEDLRVPTLWDAAADSGLAAAAVDWPITVGARLRHNLPQVWRADTEDDAKLLRALSTPGLLAEAEAVLGPWPHGSRATAGMDERKAVFGDFVLREKRPRLFLAYFASLDEEQHASGPFSPAAFRALEVLDAQVGRLRRAALSYGDPTLAVVSDHGFAQAAAELDLEGAQRREGLLDLGRDGRVRGAAPMCGGPELPPPSSSRIGATRPPAGGSEPLDRAAPRPRWRACPSPTCCMGSRLLPDPEGLEPRAAAASFRARGPRTLVASVAPVLRF
jgi:predicted AlkP superfamily pyrophosphatase or phosphodiesterase